VAYIVSHNVVFLLSEYGRVDAISSWLIIFQQHRYLSIDTNFLSNPIMLSIKSETLPLKSSTFFTLTTTEHLKLEAIAELDEIFSYINAAIASSRREL